MLALHSPESKNLTGPEETRTFPKGRLDIVTIGGTTMGRATFEPGWKWSESVKPIANTDSCEASHFGFVLSGRMTVQMDDGTRLSLGPNDAISIPPGHDAWTVGEEPCVVLDITGFSNYAKPADGSKSADTAKRVFIDCGAVPSESGCTLKISGTEPEVLNAAVQHAVSIHGHPDDRELRQMLQSALRAEA